jgi:cell wall-associated NlpC family hydrolase
MLDGDLWRDLVGLPFLHRGRGPKEYDCYGLLIEIYRRMGITLFDTVYSEDSGTQIKLLSSGISRWTKCDIRDGCGLMFIDNGYASHVGVALDEDRFIHATEAYKQVIISKLSGPYGKKLVGAYEYAV